jgi:Flp pilus assembly protein TadD
MDVPKPFSSRAGNAALLACVAALAAVHSPAAWASDQPDAFARGLQALKQNQFELALQQLTAAEQEHPSDPRVRNFRGIALAGLGRSVEAEAEYRQSIRLDPRQPEPYRNLGYLDWTTHRLREAEQALHTALALAPEDQFARYYVGRVELEEQRYPAAVDDLQRTSELWPNDPDFLLTLAATQLSLQRDAGASLTRAGRLKLSQAERVRYGSLLLGNELGGKPHPKPDRSLEGGIEVFRKLAAASDAAWAQFDLALALVFGRRPDEAVPVAQRVAQVQSPRQAPAWTLLGIAEARTGKLDRAIADFREAAQLAPGEEERWLDLTRELMAAGRYEDALNAVKQGLASNPGSYALRLRLGAVYLRSGRYSEAEEVFRDLIAHGQPLATTYVGLAQVLLRTGRAAEAVNELREARQRLGQSMLVAYFLGIALDRAGQPEESEQAFRQAVRLDPLRAETHLALGKSELRLRRVEAAQAELQETLRLDPDNAQAKRLLAQAFAMQHDPVEAARYVGETHEESIQHTEALEEDDFVLPSWQYPLTAVDGRQ